MSLQLVCSHVQPYFGAWDIGNYSAKMFDDSNQTLVGKHCWLQGMDFDLEPHCSHGKTVFMLTKTLLA